MKNKLFYSFSLIILVITVWIFFGARINKDEISRLNLNYSSDLEFK
jgi:Na+/H+ antiporter NhaC